MSKNHVFKIYLIALVESTQGLMCRLIDANNPQDLKQYPERLVIQGVGSGAVKVENIKVEDGKLVGTNGSIDRYPRIDASGNLMNKPSMVIFNQIGDVGYTVCDYAGRIKMMSTADAVEYARKFDIANGKLVSRDNIDFISSITGKYDVKEVPRVKETSKAKVQVKKRDNTRLAENSEVEAELLLDQKDSLGVLTESQRNAVKNFYIWYTVGQYQDLAKSIKLNLAPGKLETLTELRGEEDWVFAGIEDLMITQASYGNCTLGHQLRYAYYAAPVSSSKDPSTWIIFGKDCAGDFFDISKEDMEKLVTAKNNMTDELTVLVKQIQEGTVQKAIERTAFLNGMIKKGIEKKVLTRAFGEVARYAVDYLRVGLPLPKSLVLEMSKQFRLRGEQWGLFLEGKHDGLLKELRAGMPGKLTRVFGYMGAMSMYYYQMTQYVMDGYYGYNPLDDLTLIEDPIERRLKARKDVGGYNKDTRGARLYVNRKLRDSLGDIDSLEGFEKTLDLCGLLQITGRVLATAAHRVGYMEPKTAYMHLTNIIHGMIQDTTDDAKLLALNTMMNGTEIVMNKQSGYLRDFKIELTSTGYRRDYNKAPYVLEKYMSVGSVYGDIYEEISKRLEEKRAQELKEAQMKEDARKEDPIYRLERYLEKYPEGNGSNKLNVAISILDKDIPFGRLSEKQQYRIKAELAIFEEMEKGNIVELTEQKPEEEVQEEKTEKNPLERFADYLKKYPEGNYSDYLHIPKSFVEKGLTYESLSPKQKNALMHELAKFDAMAGVKSEEVWDDTLMNHKEILDIINELVDANDKGQLRKVKVRYGSLIGIIDSVRNKGRVSEKQYKYIKRAYETYQNM